MVLDNRKIVMFGDRTPSNDPMEEANSPYIKIFGLEKKSDSVPEKRLRTARGNI
jgi:hypothetical protein